MTNIIERIDKHLINDDAEQRNWEADGLLEDAAQEIERLMVVAKVQGVSLANADKELKALRSALQKANATNSRLGQKNHDLRQINSDICKINLELQKKLESLKDFHSWH